MPGVREGGRNLQSGGNVLLSGKGEKNGEGKYFGVAKRRVNVDTARTLLL